MIPVLRRAADHGLELACDNMSKWDDDIRAQVLAASRTYDLFHYGTTGVADVADGV